MKPFERLVPRKHQSRGLENIWPCWSLLIPKAWAYPRLTAYYVWTFFKASLRNRDSLNCLIKRADMQGHSFLIKVKKDIISRLPVDAQPMGSPTTWQGTSMGKREALNIRTSIKYALFDSKADPSGLKSCHLCILFKVRKWGPRQILSRKDYAAAREEVSTQGSGMRFWLAGELHYRLNSQFTPIAQVKNQTQGTVWPSGSPRTSTCGALEFPWVS